jgi:hypothetical protein
MLGGTRVNFAGRLVAQGDYSSIAICLTNRDILRDMWNVLRYLKILCIPPFRAEPLTVFSRILFGKPD